jgi:aminoglycoside 6'-N-acetyltransferase I
MIVRRIQPSDITEWLRMRSALWPECPLAEHQAEMRQSLEDQDHQATFVAELSAGRLCGFLEASQRLFAEGCATSPVGYIEGWYVEPDQQRRGIGRLLVAAAEAWAAQKGCREMASDCLDDNLVSLAAHQALGYQVAERLIHLKKIIAPAD